MSPEAKRTVLFITGSRGEYGYIRPLLRRMSKSATLGYRLLVTNMHLLPDFGNSVAEFQRDGFHIDYKVNMAVAGYTQATMTKSLGVFMMSLSDVLENQPPSMILLAGDRGEQLMAAIAGAHMNIPVAHIQAGEVSGNIDGLSRHAIARFAHIHFAANSDAEQRLLKSGEEPFRVHRVGAPQLDEFAGEDVLSPAAVAERFGFDMNKPLVLVVQHPVTEQYAQAGSQMAETMKAVAAVGQQTVVVYPNNDAGSMAVQECIQQHRNIRMHVVRNVPREVYGGLLKTAAVMVGNSSSGLIEAPLFCLPAVNVGRRQDGRFHGRNVINVPEHEALKIEAAIDKALSKGFRESLKGMESPYGDGHASDRIVSILESVPLDEKLLFKRLTY